MLSWGDNRRVKLKLPTVHLDNKVFVKEGRDEPKLFQMWFPCHIQTWVMTGT